MSVIEVHADLPLETSIVLSAQDGSTYAPLEMAFGIGDRATVSLAVPADDMARACADGRGYANYWVNARVDVLHVDLVIEDVSVDDMDRLLGRHPSAEVFVGQGQSFQEARALGRRVVGAAREAANAVIRALRYGYGQHWLAPVSEPESAQHFLLATGARWRVPGGEWAPLWVEPYSVVLMGPFGGITDQYLTESDWRALARQVTDGDEPLTGFALVAEARQRFAIGDRQMAVIHLSSALEWTVQRFLEGRLAGVLPAKSLQTILKQSHGRLLDDWVLPLARELKLDLEAHEWPSVKLDFGRSRRVARGLAESL